MQNFALITALSFLDKVSIYGVPYISNFFLLSTNQYLLYVDFRRFGGTECRPTDCAFYHNNCAESIDYITPLVCTFLRPCVQPSHISRFHPGSPSCPLGRSLVCCPCIHAVLIFNCCFVFLVVLYLYYIFRVDLYTNLT